MRSRRFGQRRGNQGDFKQKVIDLLIKEGYTKTKGVGG